MSTIKGGAVHIKDAALHTKNAKKD